MLLLYLAARQVDLREVERILVGANGYFLILTLASVLINNLAKTWRWKLLLGPAGRQIKFHTYLGSFFTGQMINTFLPARIGDLNRAYEIGGMGPGRAYVLGTIVVEKLLDMISYALLFIFLLFLMPLPEWVGSSGYAFAALTVFFSVAIFWITYRRQAVAAWLEKMSRKLPAWPGWPGRSRFQDWGSNALHSGLASLDVLQKRIDILRLALVSALIWGTAILTNHLALLAIGIHLPLLFSLFVLVALQAGISIATLPGRIGIFETICVLSLAVFEIGQPAALSYGILLHVLVFLPLILLGLVFFWQSELGKARYC